MFHTSSIDLTRLWRNGGLYANIHAKRKAGRKPRRKPGAKGAPTAQDFKNAAKTAKKRSEAPTSFSFQTRCLYSASKVGKALPSPLWSGQATALASSATRKRRWKFIQWLVHTDRPTDSGWFDQFDEDGSLPELDMEKIKKKASDLKHIWTRKIQQPRLRWSCDLTRLHGLLDSWAREHELAC